MIVWNFDYIKVTRSSIILITKLTACWFVKKGKIVLGIPLFYMPFFTCKITKKNSTFQVYVAFISALHKKMSRGYDSATQITYKNRI